VGLALTDGGPTAKRAVRVTWAALRTLGRMQYLVTAPHGKRERLCGARPAGASRRQQQRASRGSCVAVVVVRHLAAGCGEEVAQHASTRHHESRQHCEIASVPQRLMPALSQQSPRDPIERATPAFAHACPNASDTNYDPWPEWWISPASGRRPAIATVRTWTTRSERIWSAIDQPTIRREKAS
jgi:hypothetical protein